LQDNRNKLVTKQTNINTNRH